MASAQRRLWWLGVQPAVRHPFTECGHLIWPHFAEVNGRRCPRTSRHGKLVNANWSFSRVPQHRLDAGELPTQPAGDYVQLGGDVLGVGWDTIGVRIF